MRIDDPSPGFELPDLDGAMHRLEDYSGQIVVLDFWSADCPHVERTDGLIAEWQAKWGEAVTVLPIASNANETIQSMSECAAQRNLPVVLVDKGHQVADVYAAQYTPEVFVIDEGGRLRYRGAVDDTSFAQRTPTRFFLEVAVRSLLAGEAMKVRETRAFGCTLIRERLE
jgi:peroxiredoxin